MSFDSCTVIANNVHLWQEFISQLHDCAFTSDMLLIFQIPDVFDIYIFSSTSSFTRVFDGINGFEHPELTNDHYYNWQTFVRTYRAEIELQSNSWMETHLKTSMDPAFYATVMVEYEELPTNKCG